MEIAPRRRAQRRPRHVPPRAAAAALLLAAVLGLTTAVWILRHPGPPAGAAGAERSVLVDFQRSRFGAIPAELEFDATRSGPPAWTPRQAFGRPSWRVLADPFAPSPELVLVRAATAPDHDPIALLRGVTVRDLSASVFIKPMGGGRGSGAGLAWRVHDPDTYQAVLADARSHQLRLLAVAGGRARLLATAPIRIGIEYERRTPSPTHGWFKLRIDVSGERVTAWFDGRRTIELADQSRIRAGGVGLITQADAVAAFDDLHIRYLTRGTEGP